MEVETINVSADDLRKLIQDVAMIKEVLMCHRPYPDPEGELSDWAKKELKEARNTPEEECISMEDIEKEFLK